MTDAETDAIYREWSEAARANAPRTPCPGCGVDSSDLPFYRHDPDCPLQVWLGEQSFPAVKPPTVDFYHETVTKTGLDPRAETYQPDSA